MEEACRRGDLKTVAELVRSNPKSVARADGIGITPLHRAAAGNHLQLVRFLLSRGAEINAVDKYLDSPLKKAAYGGHVAVVNELVLNGANLNHADQSGKLPLHHSAEQGQLQSVEILLDAKLVYLSSDLCVELISFRRSEVNYQTVEGLTALHLAAAGGHTWCCKALLVARAYVDARGGSGGNTPLHLAAAGGHTFTVRLLISERAGLEIPDVQGRKAISLCKTEETKTAMRSALVKTSCHGPSCTAEGPGLQPEVRTAGSISVCSHG
jgi:ankyrin repeat protein